MSDLPWYPERRQLSAVTSQTKPSPSPAFDLKRWREIVRDGIGSAPREEADGETRVIHLDGLVYCYSPHGNLVINEDMWEAIVNHPEVKKAFGRLNPPPALVQF